MCYTGYMTMLNSDRTPFDNLPFNTNRAYVMALSIDNCEIYIPVTHQDPKFQDRKRDELQYWLNNQYVAEPEPLFPRTA